MDRIITYPGAIPLAEDHLNQARNTLIGLGYLAQMATGPNIVVDGLPCTPTTPASMAVLVGPGIITQPTVVDQNAYSTLSPDSDPLFKVGINTTSTTFGLTAPGTAGQTVNYLIEGVFQELDDTSTVENYYNSTNPAVPFSGPANSGGSLPTRRAQRVSLQLKAGVAAASGTQATPAVDAGWTGLWIVTVNAGATQIIAANISQYPGAPWITRRLGIGTEVVTNPLVGGSNEILGACKPFFGRDCPAGYILPIGQSLSKTVFSALYAAMGGSASPFAQDSTTFAVPDMRGRTAYGIDMVGGLAANRITAAGSGTAAVLGASLGSESMPSHGHGITEPNGGAGHDHSTTSNHAHTASGSADPHSHTIETGSDFGFGGYNGQDNAIGPNSGGSGTASTDLYPTLAVAVTVDTDTANVVVAKATSGVTVNASGTGTAGNLSPGIACFWIMYTGV